MNRGWIVELEPGVYKADGVGRTLLLDSAKRYGTISAATHGLAVMRSMGLNFINAKIYHDDHIKALAQDDGEPEANDNEQLDLVLKIRNDCTLDEALIAMQAFILYHDAELKRRIAEVD
jgi:hypothetical protein